MPYPREESTGYTRKYRHQRRSNAIALLGGKCIRCSSTENLEFDHIDPSTKIKSIGAMFTDSIESFMAEVSKCQLLCHDCHLAKSKAEGALGKPKHGTYRRYYRAGCRCDLCVEAWPQLRAHRNRLSLLLKRAKKASIAPTSSPVYSNGREAELKIP